MKQCVAERCIQSYQRLANDIYIASDSHQIIDVFLCIPLYSLAGAVTLQPFNRFGSVERPEAVDYLQCNGSEGHLSQCEINSQVVRECGLFEVAGVVCQGIAT